MTEASVVGFIDKLEKHATIKLSPSVIAELRAITPSSYTGFFVPGQEVEAWASSKCAPARTHTHTHTHTRTHTHARTHTHTHRHISFIDSNKGRFSA